jgi:hypothetical protein
MQQPRITAADVERFVDALARRDRKAAARQALGLLEAGAPVQELIQGLLGSAQAEVGRRWEANQWSVADEHAATAITDAVLGALAWRIEAAEDQGHIVVTCAEGEWHSLPARMAAEVLRLHGWRVTFLGASTPADHLRRLLAEVDAVGWSLAARCRSFSAARSARSRRRSRWTSQCWSAVGPLGLMSCGRIGLAPTAGHRTPVPQPASWEPGASSRQQWGSGPPACAMPSPWSWRPPGPTESRGR